MYNLLLTLLLVMSAIIVIAVFMQPQKNPSSMDCRCNRPFHSLK